MATQYDGYRGMEGGIVGAYERTKRRHQRKYASNPNPNRAAQQVKRQQSSEPVRELTDDRINLHQLKLLLAEANGGMAPSDADVWVIMMACNPDESGRIKIKHVPTALKLFKESESSSGIMTLPAPPRQQPSCHSCTIC
uniref:Uncharacterized protein n=1 Tax=Chlamydomonas leiostraca TaxID=1034604 RepID=A0A7S0RDR0_9CHLO|mmetsp:Transcript_20350/g.51556  ORF Transcript_20350/g.51556 Transcript_20350/m.51556 type:complete len:139 (+) Transcript_20350:36-452(+)|eukprot:CAMPEP_0202858806 /NCGR_PEP_ID=MMETSP1391-20130828/1179_1 /ASSEMBLY_ACC=CAM_ASM_000867 /TAXON_ID=1034604 /ORGANISM="Chlamydomonas leiostraca, Strain SAG 11-49" /LENGTH=138 /DNA_ID=CAMNT_0049537767 /DNA_START=36 /DNA_END=452 /DNA_ORIENTATION=-